MATALVLKPYEKHRRLGWFSRLTLGTSLVGLAAFYGLLCAILPMQLLVVPLFPVLLILLLILWMLPDIGGVRDVSVASWLVLFLIMNALWPPIAAINLPGIPVILPTRVFLFGVLTIFCLNFATSSEMRGEVIQSMRAMPLLNRLFWLFWVTTLISVPIAYSISFSISKWINNQIYWTLMLAASAWLATRPGFPMRVARVLGWTLPIIAVLGINEYRMQEMWWPAYLPPWLRSDPALYLRLFEPSFRAYTTEYRVRGQLGNALYTAEYLALVFPFLVYFLMRAKRLSHTIYLSAGVLASMMTMYFTSSRSAMIGLVLTLAVYPLLESLRVRRQRPSSLMASTVFYAYPIFAVMLAATVVFWRRAHVLILGGYQTQASTDARSAQWAMGWPKIFRHPFGQGAGNSGDVLGFFNPGRDAPTVDSYYLTLLLDYGFLGFAFFFALLACTVWMSGRAYIDARDEETLLLAPIAIAFTNFLIIKSAASSEASFPVVFVLLGIAIALVSRVRADTRVVSHIRA